MLPQYGRLQTTIAKQPTKAALQSLYRYLGDPRNENPAACEAIALEEQIARKERLLVALAAGSSIRLAPAAAFHCPAFDPRSIECNGTVADGTAQPDAVALRRAFPVTRPVTARLLSRLPDAKLVGLYRPTLADILNGRPVQKLPANQPITLDPGSGDRVLIALFTAPAPYKFRKLVWYY